MLSVDAIKRWIFRGCMVLWDWSGAEQFRTVHVVGETFGCDSTKTRNGREDASTHRDIYMIWFFVERPKRWALSREIRKDLPHAELR